MRHVSQEEDKMRREDAGLHPLPELQDGMYIYTGGEEEKSTKRVSVPRLRKRIVLAEPWHAE
jgi:hypothetical protein